MIKKLAVVLVLIAVIGVAIWSRFGGASASDTLTLYGNVDIRQVTLAFENADRVVEMDVEEGDHVNAGQVLAKLDTRTPELELSRARAQVAVLEQTVAALNRGSRPEEIAAADAQTAAAEADAERVRQQLQRLESAATASNGRAVSAQDLDDARALQRASAAKLEAQKQSQRLTHLGPRQEDRRRAEAQLEAARAEQALLEHKIALAELKAPQAGVVRARLLEPGDLASPQRPVYTLALTDPKWVRAYINEPMLSRIQPGQAATVTTDSAPKQPIAGRIGFISSVAEFTPKAVQTEDLRTSLVYEIRVLVDDPEDRLRLGMPATVHLSLSPASAQAR